MGTRVREGTVPLHTLGCIQNLGECLFSGGVVEMTGGRKGLSGEILG